MAKHGHCAGKKPSPSWVSWHNMLARCYQPFREDAPFYWGKGIRVCDRWRPKLDDGTRNPEAFLNFIADLGERPSLDYTLGRLDDDGNYEPGNVKWQTWHEQNAGKDYRGGDVVTVDGVSRTKSEWAEALGLVYHSLLRRLERGWGNDAYRYAAGKRRPLGRASVQIYRVEETANEPTTRYPSEQARCDCSVQQPIA
jgi:hypothetical protein